MMLVDVEKLRKISRALEQFREKKEGLHDHEPIEIDLTIVHWVNGWFDATDRAFDVCALYEGKRTVFESMGLSMGDESQMIFFLSKLEKEFVAKDALSSLTKVISEALDCIEGVLIGSSPFETKLEGDMDSHPSDTRINERSLQKWCSLLYWIGQKCDQRDRSAKAFYTVLKSTKDRSTIQDLDLGAMESTGIQDREFREWYLLNARSDWEPGLTVSRAEKSEKTLREWAILCEKDGLEKPTAIACSLPMDLIEASKHAIDCLISWALIQQKSKSQKSILKDTSQDGKKRSLVSEDASLTKYIIDILLMHHGCSESNVNCNKAKPLSQKEIENKLYQKFNFKTSQPTISRIFGELMQDDFDLFEAAAESVRCKSSIDSQMNSKKMDLKKITPELWVGGASWYHKRVSDFEICKVLKDLKQIIHFKTMIASSEDDEMKRFAEKEQASTREKIVSSIQKDVVEILDDARFLESKRQQTDDLQSEL